MKFFFDTEFSERGRSYPIKLISIGMVSEHGQTFYAPDRLPILAAAPRLTEGW
jgi:hypothetical protein